MANLNKVLLMGNLTREPQSKAIQQTGTPICDMGMAINRRYKTQSGEEREDVVYVDLIAYGHQADYCVKNMVKGSAIYVEGHLRYDSWTDKDTGKNRSKLRVVVDNIYHLDRKGAQMPDQLYSGYGQVPQPYGYQPQYAPMPQQQPYQPYAQPAPAYAQPVNQPPTYSQPAPQQAFQPTTAASKQPPQQAVTPPSQQVVTPPSQQAVTQPDTTVPSVVPSTAAPAAQTPQSTVQPTVSQASATASAQPPAEPVATPAEPLAPQNDEVVDDMPF